MKTLLTKFMVSRSLDTGAPVSGFWKKRMAGSPELEQFERAARALDGQLKKPGPSAEPDLPPSLHASIMRAVRAAQASPHPEAGDEAAWNLTPLLGPGLVAAALLLLGASVWLALDPWGQTGRRNARNPSVAAWPAAAPLAEQLTSHSVTVLRESLSQPIENLSRDVRETAQFLLASLP
jgi:hypothetical protein